MKLDRHDTMKLDRHGTLELMSHLTYYPQKATQQFPKLDSTRKPNQYVSWPR